MKIKYTEQNGTSYHAETPTAVISAIESARLNHYRVRVFYGDAKTGRDWCEENDVAGTVGRSTGQIKVPLLIANSRSMGGGALMDHCIVRMIANGREVYRAANYVPPVLTVREISADEVCGTDNLRAKGYTHAVDRDGGNIANFKSENAALRWQDFMLGNRMAK